MDNDDHAATPFPGIPASWDLSDRGCTLSLYWTGHVQRIVSTQPWTDAEVRAELAHHGVALPPAHRVTDAFTTALAGLVAVGERLAAANARLARGVAAALTAPGHA